VRIVRDQVYGTGRVANEQAQFNVFFQKLGEQPAPHETSAPQDENAIRHDLRNDGHSESVSYRCPVFLRKRFFRR
jgi:hypothetical protein